MSTHRTLLILGLSLLALRPLGAQPAEALPPGARLRLGTSGTGQGEGVIGAMLAPDGKCLAVVHREDINLIDRRSGKPLAKIDAPLALAPVFSPDGKRLAFGNRQTVIIAEVASGTQAHALDVAGRELANPRGLSFSANGKVIAAGERAATTRTRPVAHAWDAASGKHLGTFPVAQNVECSTALAPDGKRLATWGRHVARMIDDDDEAGQLIEQWDVATGKKRAPLKVSLPGVLIHAVRFAPDGKTIAVAAGMSWFYLFDADSGREQCRFAGRRGTTTAIEFSPDGKLLVAATANGTVQAWSTLDGKRLTLPAGPRCRPTSMVFDGDQILVLGYTTQSVVSWDARVGPAAAAQGHEGPVLALAFTADGHTLVSGGADGALLRWDMKTGRLRQHTSILDEQLQRGAGTAVRLTTLMLSPDGRYAVTNTIYRDTIRLWDASTGQPACDFQDPQGRGTFGAAFTPRGDRLATAGLRKTVETWEADTGRPGPTLAYGRGGNLAGRGVPGLTYAPDGNTLAVALAANDPNTGALSGHVLLLDVATGKERLSLEAPPTGAVPEPAPPVALSPDSRRLALAGPNGSVTVVDAHSGKTWKRLEPSGGFLAIRVLAFSPDGRTLAIAYGGQAVTDAAGNPIMAPATVEVWELASRGRRALFQGHRGAIHCLAFAPDSRTLASGSADATIVLWDLAGRQQPPADLAVQWTQLAKADAAAAFQAQRRLLAVPAETLAFLAKQLHPAQPPAVAPKQIAQAVADLDSEEFNVRDLAFRKLEKLGAIAEAALRTARAGKVSLEMRRRIDDLLDKLDRGNLTAEQLQAVRAVEVLERLGTAPARELLTRLAGGAESAVLTREARQALGRLKRQ